MGHDAQPRVSLVRNARGFPRATGQPLRYGFGPRDNAKLVLLVPMLLPRAAAQASTALDRFEHLRHIHLAGSYEGGLLDRGTAPRRARHARVQQGPGVESSGAALRN